MVQTHLTVWVSRRPRHRRLGCEGRHRVSEGIAQGDEPVGRRVGEAAALERALPRVRAARTDLMIVPDRQQHQQTG